MGGRKANDIGTARVCIDVNKGMRKSSSGAFVHAAITLDWIFFVNVLFDNHVALCLRTGLFFFLVNYHLIDYERFLINLTSERAMISLVLCIIKLSYLLSNYQLSYLLSN